MDAKNERILMNWLLLILSTNVFTILLTSSLANPILTTMFGFSIFAIGVMGARIMVLSKRINAAAAKAAK